MDSLDGDNFTMPLLTALIPVYNQNKYLPQLLNGLLNQTFKDFQVFVSDDCSTEYDPDLMWSFRHNLNGAGIRNLQARQHVNLGVLGNAKYLINLPTESKYMCIIEGDDYPFPERFEKQIKFLEENPDFGAVHSDTQYEWEDGRINSAFWKNCSGYPIEHPTSFEQLLRNNRIFTATLMARTDLFKECFDYDFFQRSGILLGDYYAVLKMASKSKIGYIDEPLAGYTHHSGSASHSVSHQKLLEETWKVQELARRTLSGQH